VCLKHACIERNVTSHSTEAKRSHVTHRTAQTSKKEPCEPSTNVFQVVTHHVRMCMADHFASTLVSLALSCRCSTRSVRAGAARAARIYRTEHGLHAVRFCWCVLRCSFTVISLLPLFFGGPRLPDLART
jgi:hypothetical protein